VTEVVDGIVDRRRGEEIELLGPAARLVQRVLEQAVTRGGAVAFARNAGIPKVMRFVDNDDIGVTQDAAEVARSRALALKIGVIAHEEADKAAVQIG
jgi:hypothetical protein